MTAVPVPCVCLVTDRRRCAPEARTVASELRALNRQLDDAIGAGVDLIQVRETDLPAAVQRDFVAALVARGAGSASRVVVNDRIDVALASGAHGVHLRGQSVPTADARALVGARLVGRSVRDLAQVRAAGAVDYLIAGTMFATPSKPAAVAWQGLAGAEALAGAAPGVPVLAIGGITIERAAALRRVGIAGIAAIGLFLPVGSEPGARGPAEAIHALRTAMRADIC